MSSLLAGRGWEERMHERPSVFEIKGIQPVANTPAVRPAFPRPAPSPDFRPLFDNKSRAMPGGPNNNMYSRSQPQNRVLFSCGWMIEGNTYYCFTLWPSRRPSVCGRNEFRLTENYLG